MRLNRLRRSYGAVLLRPRLLAWCGAAMLTFASAAVARAQSAANAPASVPAGAEEATPAHPQSPATAAAATVSPRQAREADDAYLEGARQVDRRDLAAATKSFARAAQLDPANRDYALALIVTREHRLSELVQQAAKERSLGQNERAEALLEQARQLDPDNAVITQHFAPDAASSFSVLRPQYPVADTLGDAVRLEPRPGTQNVHLRGAPQDVLRALYSQFGIAASFDPSVNASAPVKLSLQGVTFEQAERVAAEMTGTFTVPLQPHGAMIAADTQENRDRLQPQVEETIYMPGLQEKQMQEMGNLARNIFDLQKVTASPSTDTIVLRGDSATLKVLNATYEGMMNEASDVLLDVKLYEIDRTNERNIGFELPTSIGGFSVAAEAQQLVSSNQSIIDQAIAAGLIKLTGNTVTDLITEAGFLIASGAVTSTQYSNLLGIFGNGLSLAGLYVGSGATLNMLLNSSDISLLDDVQLRSGSNQEATFRAGTRYPIITSTYTAGLSSSVASAVSGLTVNGTSVSSLLQQYLGTSSVTVPQVQFEDLGLTLKATPVVMRGGTVRLKLDLKIESLGGSSNADIPVLNSRELSSEVTIPAGQSALLASQVTNSETRAVQGIPGLSELPGFQGTTDEDKQTSTGEVLITITPHVVREGSLRLASRPLLMPFNPHPGSQSFMEEQLPPPAPPQAPHAPGTLPNGMSPRGFPSPGGTVTQPLTTAPR